MSYRPERQPPSINSTLPVMCSLCASHRCATARATVRSRDQLSNRHALPRAFPATTGPARIRARSAPVHITGCDFVHQDSLPRRIRGHQFAQHSQAGFADAIRWNPSMGDLGHPTTTNTMRTGFRLATSRNRASLRQLKRPSRLIEKLVPPLRRRQFCAASPIWRSPRSG